MAVDFSDLDDLDSAASKEGAKPKPAVATVPCLKCGGSGRFISRQGMGRDCGTCFNCKDTGRVRADYQKRKDAYRKGEATRRQNLAVKATAWMRQYQPETDWMERAVGRGFEFAISLQNKLNEYGSLTEGQLAAVRKCMQSDEVRHQERAQEQAARSTQLAEAGVSDILGALKRAKGDGVTGILNPKLRTEVATFSLAKDSSANAGCVYIKAPDKTYIGKITPMGVFVPAQACTEEQKLAVLEVTKDPLNAAVLYGQKYGRCSCCGLMLTNEESRRLGIGPICRGKYFG